jgi:long-subunit acyl-CoA synthetase (AMP-forming)
VQGKQGTLDLSTIHGLEPKSGKVFPSGNRKINEDRLGTIEKVRAFHLLFESWTPENGLLTPTLKVRREVVMKQYAGEIEKMFQ